MNGLKSLAGSKSVEQDDFQNKVGVYIVKFDAPPKLKLADVGKSVAKFKVDKVQLKITSKVMEKEGKLYAGDIALANSKEEGAADVLSQIKGKQGPFVLYGVLSEDAKNNQTLTLASATEPKKE
jgi:hypothetical protein